MNTLEGTEKWAQITGYEGRYEISDKGNIRSMNRIVHYSSGRTQYYKSGPIKAVKNKRNGYYYVQLRDSKRRQKGHRVHRLVAIHFIPNPLNLPQINHEDYNKANNAATNLKWCDGFYQSQHCAKKPGRKWQKHRLGKVGKENFASKPVLVFSLSGNLIGSYESGMLAAKATDSNQTKISACCLGKRKSHNKLKFKFAKLTLQKCNE